MGAFCPGPLLSMVGECLGAHYTFIKAFKQRKTFERPEKIESKVF
jgi:hypothetical protein